MTPSPFLTAFRAQATQRPEQMLWTPAMGLSATYGDVLALVDQQQAALRSARLPAIAGERLAVDAELGASRFAWALTGLALGLPTLALSPYQRSGRFEDLKTVWQPHLLVLDSPKAARGLAPREGGQAWSAVYDLNHGQNQPSVGMVGESLWLKHWQNLVRSAPLAAGERVATVLPDTIGTWFDLWAWAATQGAELFSLPQHPFMAPDQHWDWPSGTLHAHMTASQAMWLRAATIPAGATVWIHGPFPAWLPQRVPGARAFPVPPMTSTLEAMPKQGWSAAILYQFSLGQDPHRAWRQQKEAQLMAIPGVLEAIVPVHPLDSSKPRPVGVVCLEEDPLAIAQCRQAVEDVCENDALLATAALVWMGPQYLRYHSLGPDDLVGDSLSLVQYMADTLADQARQDLASL